MREEEFSAAYESFSDALFRHCYFRLYDREKSKDIVQEAFIKTWEYSLKGQEIENTRAFLYKVLNNLIIDEIRKKKALSLEILLEEGFQPIDGKEGRRRLENFSDFQNLLRIIHKMEENKKNLLIMRYIDELGPKEIAHILGENENVISVRLNRALKELKEIFHNE